MWRPLIPSPQTWQCAVKDEEEDIHTRQTSRTQSSGYETVIFLFIVLEILSMLSHSKIAHALDQSTLTPRPHSSVVCFVCM